MGLRKPGGGRFGNRDQGRKRRMLTRNVCPGGKGGVLIDERNWGGWGWEGLRGWGWSIKAPPKEL